MLKGLKKGCGYLLNFSTSVVAGATTGFFYNVLTGFKCATNLQGDFSVNLAGVNYTEIENAIYTHGVVKIPFNVDIDSNTLSSCASPILYGAIAAGALSLGYIALDTAYQCHKAKTNKRSRGINDEESPLLRQPEERSKFCCV